MKNEKEISELIKKLESSLKLKQPIATIDINAPLALIQLELESRIAALKWVIKK